MANFLPGTTRRRLTTMAATAAAVVLTASLAPSTGAAAAGPGATREGAANAAAPARTVDVMTRNLYLGADLMPVILALAAAPDPENPLRVPLAAQQTWLNVQATRPPERIAAIADEIAAAKPAVVGLQEVTVWKTYATVPTGDSGGTVVYDFLDLLLDALADRGVQYREVKGATSNNFASPPVPMLTATGGLGAVSLADRDVIIKRAGVKTWNAQNDNFDAKVIFPLTPPLVVERGWGSVDVRTKLATFRFVNSHLEAFGVPGLDAELVRYAQVGELLAAQQMIAQQSDELPMVYVGDYNTEAPGAIAYKRLLAGVGFDAWTLVGDATPGDTCCFNALVVGPTDPTDTSDPLDSRIDLVLVDDAVTPVWATRVGEDPSTDLTPSGLWPSDHAGVVARLVIDRVVPAGPVGRSAPRHRR